MSGLFPTSITISATSLKSLQPVLVDYTQSSRRQVRKVGGHRWGFSVDLPKLTSSEWREVLAFFMSQDSQYQAFTIIHPLFASPKGLGGYPAVKGAGQSGTSLVTDNWPINTSNVLKKGDIFQVSGNSKVYLMTSDASSNGIGEATLNFKPSLISQPADNALVSTIDVPFTVMLASQTPDMPLTPPDLGTYQFSVVEVLS